MYELNRLVMRTGDVIAFSGKGRVSEVIKTYTRSDISHVGIVFKNENGRVIIMESTTLLDKPDLVTGEFIKGVQQQYLSDRIKAYDGLVYWCGLTENIKIQKQADMIKWLSDVHGKRTSYDALGAVLAGSYALNTFDFARDEDFSSLFCSELVTKALQIAGVVSDKVLAASQTPQDVLNFKCIAPKVLLTI